MKLYFRTNKAFFSTPTASSVTASGFTVNGSINFFKDGTWGVAYKKHSASTWVYKACASKDIAYAVTGASAATAYDVKLFVKMNGEYQYSEAIEVATSAAE